MVAIELIRCIKTTVHFSNPFIVHEKQNTKMVLSIPI